MIKQKYAIILMIILLLLNIIVFSAYFIIYTKSNASDKNIGQSTQSNNSNQEIDSQKLLEEIENTEDASEIAISEAISENISEEMSEEIPEEISENISENISEEIPEKDTDPVSESVTEEEIPKKYIALTFDDGPSREITPLLLDILSENEVKATFFVLGSNVKKNPEIITRMYEEGHEIGNHSYGHKDLTTIKKEAAIAQIDDTNNLIFEITGQIPVVLRPPYGNRDSRLADLCEERGMAIIVWDVDPQDWKVKNSELISTHIINKTKENSIILLHDLYNTTLDSVLDIITGLKAEGYEFCTVSELLEMGCGFSAGSIYRNAKEVAKN